MKKALFLFVVIFTCMQITAQTIKPAKPLNADALFSEALSKVVQDFTFNFVNIQGARMPAEVDADTYRSKICMPAALGCKIMRYHSVEDKSASWQAVLYAGENFEEALKVYKKAFTQVKKTAVKNIGVSTAGFDGKLDAVDENVGFAVSSLRLKTTDSHYKNLVAEIEMVSGYTGWEVQLNVYTKKLVEEKEEQE